MTSLKIENALAKIFNIEFQRIQRPTCVKLIGVNKHQITDLSADGKTSYIEVSGKAIDLLQTRDIFLITKTWL